MNNYINDNTICAISTAAGSAAIAIVRMSGTKAKNIAEKIFQVYGNKKFQHSNALVGKIIDLNNKIVDEVVVTYFQTPNSYTGEDIIEIACHGSNYIQQKILELLVDSGATMALPGEFTYRAFKNGKIDLSQAEAVADLILSENKQAHDVAINQLKGTYSSTVKDLRNKLINFTALLELELDFSEEDLEFVQRDELLLLLTDIEKELITMSKSFELGNYLKNGIPVAIVGKPNVGKSTLLNILLDEDKAIVSDIPGTTRDVIEDVININGFLYRFIDTAGLRETDNLIESMGIERTIKRIKHAKIVLLMLDLTEINENEVQLQINNLKENMQNNDVEVIIVCNKIDELETIASWREHLSDLNPVYISAKRKENINLLIERISNYINTIDTTDSALVTNVRHYDAMQKALTTIRSAKQAFEEKVSTDLIAIDIRQSLYYLGTIIGEVTTDDILDNVFSNFCIGK